MENLAYFNEKEYLEGFNLGYRISGEIPELGELIYSAKGESSKLDGLKDGRQQYLEDMLVKKDLDREQRLQNHPSWLSDDRLSNLDREIGSNKGKDIEPEV